MVNQVTDPEPLGGGYIGLRNLMGVDAVSYDNFIVYSVGKSVAKAGRNDLAAETRVAGSITLPTTGTATPSAPCNTRPVSTTRE